MSLDSIRNMGRPVIFVSVSGSTAVITFKACLVFSRAGAQPNSFSSIKIRNRVRWSSLTKYTKSCEAGFRQLYNSTPDSTAGVKFRSWSSTKHAIKCVFAG